jgi:hypothetical protein
MDSHASVKTTKGYLKYDNADQRRIAMHGKSEERRVG